MCNGHTNDKKPHRNQPDSTSYIQSDDKMNISNNSTAAVNRRCNPVISVIIHTIMVIAIVAAPTVSTCHVLQATDMITSGRVGNVRGHPEPSDMLAML